MVVITNFFKLIRLPNIIIIALTQILIKKTLINPFCNTSALSNLEFGLLILSTILIASAGNIINDYFDVKVDTLNGKSPIIGNSISKEHSIILYSFLNLIGVSIGFYLSNKIGVFSIGFINLFCAISLFIYSSDLKRKPIFGNIVVALLSSLVLLVVPLFELAPYLHYNTKSIFIIAGIYAIFAFLVSIIREIVKDLEDIEGDRLAQHNTMAVTIGTKKTKNIALLLSVLLVVLILLIMILQFKSSFYSFLYVLLALKLPISYTIYKIKVAKTKKDFWFISQLLKIIMLLGILSMFIFWLIYN
ncbi:MAG: geranylgeranylglycerol-phosphate geranylgeranyltransferase [Flavobacteriales bacterium]